MPYIAVLVESPAKCGKIEKFLGAGYKCMATFGHIRSLNNLSNIVTNTQASVSNIRDADFSSETSRLTRAQILNQAATSMLAQANASKQTVLQLLQG